MDFTREPIIETVITPKEGCKLVVRSSKTSSQEEYFVDAVEIVSFGHTFFFRSTEKPKAFLVPTSDYEVLEVREARMVLKNVGIDRTIKIAGGREGHIRSAKEPAPEKGEDTSPQAAETTAPHTAQEKSEGKGDKKRDRRRQNRRRRGRDGGDEEGTPATGQSGEAASLSEQVSTTSVLTSLLPPPPTLISETLAKYKDNALFKDAFYSKEDNKEQETVSIPQPEYGSFEMSEAEEEEIYQQRKMQSHNTNHETPIINEDNNGNHQPFSHENHSHLETETKDPQ